MIRAFWKADLAKTVRLFLGTKWTFTGVTIGHCGFGVIRRFPETTTGVDLSAGEGAVS